MRRGHVGAARPARARVRWAFQLGPLAPAAIQHLGRAMEEVFLTATLPPPDRTVVRVNDGADLVKAALRQNPARGVGRWQGVGTHHVDLQGVGGADQCARLGVHEEEPVTPRVGAVGDAERRKPVRRYLPRCEHFAGYVAADRE